MVAWVDASCISCDPPVPCRVELSSTLMGMVGKTNGLVEVNGGSLRRGEVGWGETIW
jgi:hypothetical protein